MERTSFRRVLALAAAGAVAAVLLAFACVYGGAQSAAAVEPDAPGQAAGAVCAAPESCCANAEDVARELGRV